MTASLSHHWLGTRCCEFVVREPLSPALFRRLESIAERLRGSETVDAAISSYGTIAVYWNQTPCDLVACRDRVSAEIYRLLNEAISHDFKATEHHVEVTFDGPDLQFVADHTGLTIRELIATYTASTLSVAAIGFKPHFGYLWGLPEELATPRRSSPRVRVPVGAVGIADRQTGIYPCETPGGWQLIGSVAADTCAALCPQLRVGDTLRMHEKPA